jgi:hypothetical protein
MPRKLKYTKEQLAIAVANSTCLFQALQKVFLNPRSGHYPGIKKRIKEWNIDTSHFVVSRGGGWNRGQECGARWGRRIPLEEILVENSTYVNNVTLKRRLLKFGLKQHKCEVCGMGAEWNGKSLVLQLDHINGIHSDNRIENLRIICPNCHTQTSTFCSRNRKTRIDNYCGCGNKIGLKSKTCVSCRAKISRKTKIAWPEPTVLEEWLWREPAQKIAKQLGIGETAVRKFCTKHGIKKPGRGYWQKKYGK